MWESDKYYETRFVEKENEAKTIMDIRPSVLAFAHEMEAKLRENEHKGGWEPNLDWTYRTALSRLREEVVELSKAIQKIPHDYGGVVCGCRYTGCPHALANITPEFVQDIVREAADVGNFAMMISDMVSGMPHGNLGGR